MLKKYFSKVSNIRSKKSNNSFNLIDFGTFLGDDEINGVAAYQNNVVVYRSVNLIAQAASHVPWLVLDNKSGKSRVIHNHPIYKLLRRLNHRSAGVDFFAEVISNLLLFGNAYIFALCHNNKPPSALYLLGANNVEIVVNNGKAISYKYTAGDKSTHYPINSVNEMSKILHLKTYNPRDQLYGLSSLEAAAIPIETHHMASKWNNSLLKNGARPSGALVMKDSAGYLSDDQFERLKDQLNEKYTGASNAGKPLLLEGGLEWKEMSISPKDMDFIESKNSAAREIALAFGVPPQLLGINGDNTYSNMQEARLALWEETVIPLLDKISDALTHWFAYWFHEDIIISFDRDAISALTSKRENLWDKISNSNFMTINEKRAFIGLEPIKDGDVIA